MNIPFIQFNKFGIMISSCLILVTLISLLSALFSIQLKRNKIVQFVIILPFFIPIVIFTTTSEKFAELNVLDKVSSKTVTIKINIKRHMQTSEDTY